MNCELKKIPSFTIDHTRLQRGVYLSRQDVTPAGEAISTYDVRMTEPNRQAPLSPEAQHALEHIAATWLRNHPYWADRTVYWGPMGCCTGSYLILMGTYDIMDVADMLREMMEYIAAFDGPVPGATPRDCGQYAFMDLPGARRAAAQYLEVLRHLTADNLRYPE